MVPTTHDRMMGIMMNEKKLLARRAKVEWEHRERLLIV
jgi:hypothetical protein